jgi:hypothetical protein
LGVGAISDKLPDERFKLRGFIARERGRESSELGLDKRPCLFGTGLGPNLKARKENAGEVLNGRRSVGHGERVPRLPSWH